ncbi:FbpB family small basic protein [Lentibacillus cibarius]|uniref:FbpB family small basic protein n=1 Tax=Lentibacillus cibarius TaxID=2583219 RepID=A0A549YK37_9BACI|nr:FbpB family small basic protein [Lentibacillus cibarius]TRM12237.1 FbpB family small basic protein [Lentibacillus cibarius]
MRSKYQNFEDLVRQNKQELLDDDKKVQQLEYRLDEKVISQSTDNMEQNSLQQ